MQDSMGCMILETKLNAEEPSSTDRHCSLWATDGFEITFADTELVVTVYT